MRDFSELPHPLADFCEHAGVGKACGSCRDRLDKIVPPATRGEIHATARELAEEHFQDMGVSIQKVTADVVDQFFYRARLALNGVRYDRMDAIEQEDRLQRQREKQEARKRTKERMSAS